MNDILYIELPGEMELMPADQMKLVDRAVNGEALSRKLLAKAVYSGNWVMKWIRLVLS